jgi:probable poly-beta-1,6-N-acetyl-D-glucosamine export protein
MRMGVLPDGPPGVARQARAAATAAPCVPPSDALGGQTQQAGGLKPQDGCGRLDELDRLRVITALAVVAVHVLAMSAALDRTPSALYTQFGVVHALHFTREVFVFVTAMALVYAYYDKSFSPSRFWQRRGIGVLLPYVMWSVVYVALSPPSRSPLHFVGTLLWDVLTGGASYQLYYILLTIQFYLLLPWFLRVLRRIARHPWRVLGASFALQIGLLWAASLLLTARLRLPGGVQAQLPLVCDRCVLLYQFYFVLGAMAALHVRDVRAFVLRHGSLVVATALAALIAWEAHYVVAVAVTHMSDIDASSVVQPGMAVYSAAMIGLLYWLVYRGLAPGSPGSPRAAAGPRSGAMWRTLSNAAFGIYLVHPLFLSATLTLVVPHLQTWPVALLVPCIWLLTASAATTLSLLLLATPLLSRLVGHPHVNGETGLDARIKRTLAMAGVGARGPVQQGAGGGSHGSHQSARLRSAGASMHGSGHLGHVCTGERR